MREIKFRGKRVDNGEFIIGNLFIPNKLLAGVFICPDTTYGNFLPGFEDGDNINDWDGCGISIGHFHEVIAETVGQFTGLKDKNGLEIYEGDILEFGTTKNHVVNFGENRKTTYGHGDCGETFYIGFYIGYSYGEQNIPEIIGNIHENPVLL